IYNAWSATNVDIKFRVNLDGEKTNFLEENQELNWQERQWVKVSFSKDDLGDIAPLGTWTNDVLRRCMAPGSSATLVPNSFIADEEHDYPQWSLQVPMPLRFADAACMEAYGPMGAAAMRMNRQNVTFNPPSSMVRATPQNKLTYKPLVVEEKDPIRHKYGPIE